ncbi:hypothetical protein, partial [Tabrizicola sp.]|uniref:hypothetical protein n=1 Tax=Tabrizicola sp. TaxID=2005166 RepID=UPI002FDDE889
QRSSRKFDHETQTFKSWAEIVDARPATATDASRMDFLISLPPLDSPAFAAGLAIIARSDLARFHIICQLLFFAI